jgi:hypothetical protein
MPTGAAAGVSLTYAAPKVDQDPSAMRFGETETGAVSRSQTLTVSNRGSAPLTVAGVLVEGDDPDDFLVENRCQEPVRPGSSCKVGVRFAPEERGARSATLRLLTNAAIAPEPVKLSGGGEGAPLRAQNEVTTRTALIACPVRVADEPAYRTGPALCRGRRISGEMELTDARAAVRATLKRGRVTYASGTSTTNADGSSLLALAERRKLKRRTYTLVVQGRRERVVLRPNATRGTFPRLSGLVF